MRRAAPLTGPLALATATLALALALSGCGKKPDFVDPPQGKANDTFPRTYPAPATLDPKPGEVAPGVKFP